MPAAAKLIAILQFSVSGSCKLRLLWLFHSLHGGSKRNSWRMARTGRMTMLNLDPVLSIFRPWIWMLVWCIYVNKSLLRKKCLLSFFLKFYYTEIKAFWFQGHKRCTWFSPWSRDPLTHDCFFFFCFFFVMGYTNSAACTLAIGVFLSLSQRRTVMVVLSTSKQLLKPVSILTSSWLPL